MVFFCGNPLTIFGESARERYHRLKDRIARSRLDLFLGALFERAASQVPQRIQLMADLLASHGQAGNGEAISSGEAKDRLEQVIGSWMEATLKSPEANRHQMADVVARRPRRGMEACRRPATNFRAGFADWTRAREEHARSGRGGSYS